MNVVNLFVTALLFCVIYAKGHVELNDLQARPDCGLGKNILDKPSFIGDSSNVTVVVGRDAVLTCTVENLHKYKVAWLRVDTQTILTIGPHVITKNHRVGVGRGNQQSWALTLRDARPTDGGRYMCQINTEPMITQTHLLQVFVPPDIGDSGTSGEVMVREGDNVTMHCAASGTPHPTITWRREDSAPITVQEKTVSKWSGEWLNMTTMTRESSGAFLCIATNGVPPSVSKRILLRVLCKPSVQVTQKMIGGYVGSSVTMQCRIEAYPTPVVYWTRAGGDRMVNGPKYQASMSTQSYKHTSVMRVDNVTREDIGAYHCHAENSLGAATDDITLYTLVTTTTSTTSTTQVTTSSVDISTTTVSDQPYVIQQDMELEDLLDEDNFVVVLSQHQMQSLDLSPSS